MPARPSESHVDGAPGLAALCRALSLAIPLVVAASRTGNAALWRDDLAVVRALGFEPLGGEGAVSALAGQLFSLLPIGGRVLRAGLAAAMGTGLAGLAVHDLLS
ncbi:MAG: hypothetical protein FJ104_05335, partial [Deltaproteobacteria bacterium]|nr:hypothetical protein [Deltaproteobacteria bacterium]